MQILGLVMLAMVVVYGFQERTMTVVSPFDLHALTMVLVGSLAAVLVGSSPTTARRTFAALRELVPRWGVYRQRSRALEDERQTVCRLWQQGNRAKAVELADNTAFAAIKQMVDLLLRRSAPEASARTFLEMRHAEIEAWQPAIHNWEMLSKLGPSFGMVGTITGMIQMFRNMTAENANIGASMSLALVATLYGVAFGAGVAGPIGHFLNQLLDERLGCLERCEASVAELVAGKAA